jgi:hypothetical protein
MSNPLGQCTHENCHADLCVRGSVVACSECKFEYPQHPASIEMAEEDRQALAKQAKRPTSAVHKMDFVSSVPERLLIVEKVLVAQGERLARLEAQLGKWKR